MQRLPGTLHRAVPRAGDEVHRLRLLQHGAGRRTHPGASASAAAAAAAAVRAGPGEPSRTRDRNRNRPRAGAGAARWISVTHSTLKAQPTFRHLALLHLILGTLLLECNTRADISRL